MQSQKDFDGKLLQKALSAAAVPPRIQLSREQPGEQVFFSIARDNPDEERRNA
jgi:hypothetical protein